jgi:hypothetical protein
MSPLSFENRISLTTIVAALNLALALIGGGAAYATIRAELRVAHATDARIISEIAAIRSEGVIQETRIRSLELGAGRTEEKLTNILASLVRIERQLEEREGGSLRP